MPRIVSPQAVLARYVARFSTQREAAQQLAISQPYLSDLLLNRRLFSEAMLAKLGLARVVVHVGPSRDGGQK